MRGVPLAAVSVLLGLTTAGAAAQQPAAPKLTRGERSAMQALVAAVDAAATATDTPPIDGPLHVLRASDGSHYVAFTLIAPPGLRADQQGVLYVRLATREPGWPGRCRALDGRGVAGRTQ